jgi:uncharacterized protein (DUF1778 family)
MSSKVIKIEFPVDEYEFLLLAAEEKKISVNDFMVHQILQGIMQVEAELDGICFYDKNLLQIHKKAE